MAELTMEEKAKLFNFGIAVKELAKKSGFLPKVTNWSNGINIDEWDGEITFQFITTECAKREEIKNSEIIEA